MAKFDKKIQAQNLRRTQGLAIKRIASLLNVSKSTVSKWCIDIELTDKQKNKLLENQKRGWMQGSLANKKKKEARIEFNKNYAKKMLGNLSKRDLLIAGIALYWAEGSKTTQFTFVNTDSAMIAFFHRWLQSMKVADEDLIPRVFINEMHRKRIKDVINHWATLLEVPKEQFRKTIFIKTKQKKIYANYDRYYGLLSIRVRNSSELKYKMLGFVGILNDFVTPT